MKIVRRIQESGFACQQEFRKLVLRILDGLDLTTTKYIIEPWHNTFFYQPENIRVAHIRGGGSIPQGHEVSACNQYRFNAHRQSPPQQSLQAQAVVIAGRAMQNGRSTGFLLQQRTQRQGAHPRPGHGIGGHTETVDGQPLQGLQGIQQVPGLRTSGGHDFNRDGKLI